MAGLKGILAGIFFLCICPGLLSAQTASFTYTMSPANGCAPVTVHFHSTSSGSPTTFIWNLGNSTPVATNNDTPSTVYTTPGTYTVTLQVSGPNGTSQVYTKIIAVKSLPVVQFSGTPLTGCPPLAVNFDGSASTPNAPPPTSYQWITGGGNPSISTGATTSVTYSSGTYNVSLIVTNSYGCSNTLTKNGYVHPSGTPVGIFSAVPTTPCTPSTPVTFTGSAVSGAPPYTYHWNFGDNTTGTGQTISHTYNGPKGACYTVKLVVIDNNGCTDTTIVNNVICISNIHAAFTAIPTSACVGTEITFNNTSTPLNGTVDWDFQYPSGFSAGSDLATHTYYMPGTYTVAMVYHSGGCADTAYKQITVYPQPTINFSFSPALPCPTPQTITFTGTGASSYAWDFGDGGTPGSGNPASHQYTTCGYYSPTLVATDNHGCKDTLTKHDGLRIYCGQLSIFPRFEKGCRPLPDTFYADLIGRIYIPGDTTFNPYPYAIATYEWDFGDGTPKSTAAIPTHVFDTCGILNVTLKVTTVNGCVFNASYQVLVGAKPHAGFTVTPTHVCPNDSVYFTNTSTYPCYTNGVITNIWDFGDNSGSSLTSPTHIYGDTAGTFCAKLVTEYNGCPDTFKACPATKIIVDSPIALFKFTYNCINRLSVAFTNQSYGVTSYYWKFPPPIGIVNTLNPTVTFPGPGIYDAKLYNTNSGSGCMDSLTKIVEIMDPTPVLTAADTTICKGDKTRFHAVYVNPSYFTKTYAWYVNDVFQTKDSAIDYTHHFTNVGYYKVAVMMMDGMGCFDTLTRPNWVLVSKPAVDFVASPVSGCAPLYVMFTDLSVQVPAAAGPLTGAPLVNRYWEFGVPGATASLSPATTSYTYASAGSYDVKLVVTDNSGCTDTLKKSAYIHTHRPVAKFSVNDSASCMNTPLTFINNSDSGVAFRWDFGDGDTSLAVGPVHSYKQTGTYTVTLVVTDTYGCKDTLAKTGYIKITRPHAAFSMSDSVAICPPLNVKFTNLSTGATAIKWIFGTGTVAYTSVPVPPQYELYTLPAYDTVYVIATDAEGCLDTAIGHVNILGYAGSFTYTPLTGCRPLEVTFNTSVQNIPSTVWDFGDGNTYTSTGSSSITHTYTSPGAFIPKIIMSSSPTCSAGSTGLDTIKVDDVIAKISHTPACEGYTVKFTDSSYSYFTKVIDWAWSFNGGPVTSNLSSTSRYYPGTGTYPVRLIVTNANGCTDTTDTVVVIHALPVISAGADTVICLTDAASLHATGGISYAWSPATALSCTDCPNPNANPTKKTEYTVIGTDANGCSDTDKVVVNIKLKVTSDVDSGGEICDDASIMLKASGAWTYVWSPADVLDNSKIATPVASPHRSTTFRVVAYEGSCIPDTNFVDVIVHPKPVVHASGGTTIIAGGDAPLQADGKDIHRFLWKPAETLSCTECPNPIAKPIRTTTYVIVASTEFNCEDSDRVTVKVLCDQSQLFIPNTFTPNNDGQNDIFYPRGVGFDRLRSFRVYDRWGELLYERTGFPLNDKTYGWDGTYKGKVLPPDVYVYAVEADCDNGQVIRWKGDITLIR